MKQVCSFYVLQHDGGTRILSHRCNLDVAETNVLHMPQIESLRGHISKHIGLGIFLFALWRSRRCLAICAAATMLNVDFVQPEVLNLVSRDAADDAAQIR